MDLTSAVRRAVDVGIEEARRLETDVNDVVGALRALASATGGAAPSASAPPIARAFSESVSAVSEETSSLFERQFRALSTYNIAFFGRTGAGKSSLLTAFGELDGERISRGESDWTTDVEPISWNACRLYDTPGINGWGRTRRREELEAAARAAVEIADIVILCFDSQSQQATEFAKVASWVRDYGKPVIAVLNCRNPRWRFPTRVPTRSNRRALSRAVSEHARNITGELEKIGLSAVPVVALQTKRAVIARAREPYRGPDAVVLRAQRAEYGVERLLAWSNFPVLERLLIAAIRQGGADLRLGMLRLGVRDAFERVGRELEGYQRAASDAGDALEAVVQASLATLGYPEGETRARCLGPTEPLTRLERAREEPFRAPAAGELESLIGQLLTAHLAPLRTRSIGRVEELVIGAFESETRIDPDALGRAVFQTEEIQRATDTVEREVWRFAQRRLRLAAEDGQADIRFQARRFSDVDGAVGSGMRSIGTATRVAGILSGAAGTLGALAVLNVWNPLVMAAGVAAAVSLVGGLVAGFFGWWGGRARRKAEERRLQARRAASADAGKAVRESYDALQRDLTARLLQLAWERAAPALASTMEGAAALREVRAGASSTALRVEGIMERLSVSVPAAVVLTHAVRRVEDELLPGERAHRRVWLGEGWVDDHVGLADTGADDDTTPRAPPPLRARSVADLSAFLDMYAGVDEGAADDWLATAHRELAEDPFASDALGELDVLWREGRPRIHVCGDYSAGKSSFIKRLLVDAGLPVPDSLHVRGDPTTEAVRSYPWRDTFLVDTPGFQGGDRRHDASAAASCADASMIIWIFHTNLLLGDTSAVETVLRDGEGGVPRLPNTLFLINRTDELGADPAEDAEGHERLVKRKAAELVTALETRGLRVRTDRVHAIASDPYGMVGDSPDARRADYDGARAWDGFRELEAAWARWPEGWKERAVATSILSGAAARMGRLTAFAHARRGEIQRKIDALDRLEVALGAVADAATVLAGDLRGDVQRIVDDHASTLLDCALSGVSAEEINANAKALATWWTDAAFLAEVEAWHQDADEKITTWHRTAISSVDRELRSSTFRRAYPEIAATFDHDALAREPGGAFRRFLATTGGTLRAVSRDAVYQIGKFFGAVFKPWGAVKLAARLGKVGAILAPAGLALDVYDFIRDIRDTKRREEARRGAVSFVQKTAPEVVAFLSAGDNGAPGPIAHLTDLRSAFDERRAGIRAEADEHRAGIRAWDHRIGMYGLLARDARRHLGFFDGEGHVDD